MSEQELLAEIARLEALLKRLKRQSLELDTMRLQVDDEVDNVREQLAVAKDALIVEMMKRKR
jgi:hypothetical protein